MNTKRDEIDDILQLANGLNGPNRLNLTKVGTSARTIDLRSLGPHVMHGHTVKWFRRAFLAAAACCRPMRPCPGSL